MHTHTFQDLPWSLSPLAYNSRPRVTSGGLPTAILLSSFTPSPSLYHLPFISPIIFFLHIPFLITCYMQLWCNTVLSILLSTEGAILSHIYQEVIIQFKRNMVFFIANYP